jgi:hypothetical protein
MRLILAGAVVSSVLVGCTMTTRVKPSELARLDGYDVQRPTGAEPVLEAINGGRVTLDDNSKLFLDLPGARVGGRFLAIDFHDGMFAGRTDDARIVQAPAEEIRAVAIEKPNNVATALLIGGLLLAAAGVALLVSAMDTMQSVPGRPLRVRGKIVAAPLAKSEGWCASSADPDVSALSGAARDLLAKRWAETARGEHASVPAFSRLSLTLMSLGAPADLVEAAHRAALEEIAHARLTFALAGAYAGAGLAPGPLPELQGAGATTATSLSRLAAESLIDGCLNEGFAAAVATAASARARDAASRDAWATIARDEASHAELAWRIVGWCLDQVGPALGAELRKAIHTAPASIAASDVPPSLEREVETHGWLPAGEERDLFQQTRLTVGSRLAALFGRTRGSGDVIAG